MGLPGESTRFSLSGSGFLVGAGVGASGRASAICLLTESSDLLDRSPFQDSFWGTISIETVIYAWRTINCSSLSNDPPFKSFTRIEPLSVWERGVLPMRRLGGGPGSLKGMDVFRGSKTTNL